MDAFTFIAGLISLASFALQLFDIFKKI